MFRSSLRSARVLSKRPLTAAAEYQWPIAASRRASVLGQRSYAVDKKLDGVPKPPILPTTETTTSERVPLVEDKPHIPEPVVGADVPLTPPAPEAVKEKRPEPTATIDDVGESAVKLAGIPNASPPPPPSPPAPKKKGFFRRLRNFVFTLLVLGAVGFSGGVWYSRINDNFHDFFTEYIPFGEQAVLYLEELEYQKRFPNAPKGSVKPRDDAEQVRIPAQSGASWRVADGGEHGARLSSAGPSVKKTPVEEAPAKPEPPKAEPKEPAQAPVAKPTEAAKPEAKADPAAGSTFKAPEVNEPSKLPPLKPIDLLSLADAREPVVQDLVHMLNDLILVINADGAHGKYGTTINKAKENVKKVGGKLKSLKTSIEKKSADEVRSRVQEFDKAATELVSRVEKAMVNQEVQWRQEFEEEMKKVRGSYDERVKLLVDREQQLNEQKLQNQLAEQAIALKKEFTQEVKTYVEKERDSRLGQLDGLTSAVKELEDLTVGWNQVVDTNLKTQQLHVAVEAVRAKLENASHPQPFVKELVALKEIATDDSVVSSAIASINPSAYQRGIFTSSQLIDRFRKVAGEVRKASLLPDDAGVASHASSWVLSHVMFKKQGLPEGNDVESILTRTQIFLEEGDLDQAAREMNGLDGWAKTLSKDWLLEIRKVLEVQQALDVIATEARLQSLRVD